MKTYEAVEVQLQMCLDHSMEMIGQLHAPFSILRRKVLPYPLDSWMGLCAGLNAMEKTQMSYPAGNQTKFLAREARSRSLHWLSYSGLKRVMKKDIVA
jgi:hypothetical protein